MFIEEIHEKQEQVCDNVTLEPSCIIIKGFAAFVNMSLCCKVKEWLQNLGIGEHTAMVHNENEHDDETVPLDHDGSVRNR